MTHAKLPDEMYDRAAVRRESPLTRKEKRLIEIIRRVGQRQMDSEQIAQHITTCLEDAAGAREGSDEAAIGRRLIGRE